MEAGHSYQTFWDLTLREVTLILRATRRREDRAAEERRQQAWHIAQLAATAVLDPKSLPDPAVFITGRRAAKKYATPAEFGAFLAAGASASS